MAERMIAYCGLVCSECPAYVATQADDSEALQRVAAEWGKETNKPLTAADCLCDGCLSDSDRLFGYCSKCKMRACAMERGVATCAHCDDYGCEKITGFLEHAPEAKTTLDQIRQAL